MSVYNSNFQKHGLSPSQLKILELVKEKSDQSLRILELGCSSGYMTRVLQQYGEVDIVDNDKAMLEKASRYAKESYVGSLDDVKFLKQITKNYDVIIAADVFEHLQFPEQCLEYFKKHLKKDGIIIFSLPNIACWRIRKELFLNGFFEYQEIGILDKTHLKFFSYNSIKKWIKSQGYKLKQIFLYEIDYPLRDTFLKLPLGKFIARFIDEKMKESYPNLCAGHMVIEISK